VPPFAVINDGYSLESLSRATRIGGVVEGREVTLPARPAFYRDLETHIDET